MKINPRLKKILKIAFYTSPLIGILAITPVFIIRTLSYDIYPRVILSITLIIFFAWVINISIFQYLEKLELRRSSFNLRYILSYLFSVSFIMLAVRMHKFFFFGDYYNLRIQRITFPLRLYCNGNFFEYCYFNNSGPNST